MAGYSFPKDDNWWSSRMYIPTPPDPALEQQLNAMKVQTEQYADFYSANHYKSATSMPWYYNALGEKCAHYAYSFGPHSGTVCHCPECAKFNEYFQSKEELAQLQQEIKYTAEDAVHHYFRGRYYRPSSSSSLSSYGGPGYEQQPDRVEMVHALRKFAQEHIARYQKQMVERVTKMQASHAQKIAAMKHELSKKDITSVPVQHPSEGRLFRMGEK